MQRCAQCSADNEPDALFCAKCGSHLEAACVSCAAAPNPGDQFCRKCGTPIDQSAPAAASRASDVGTAAEHPVSERRVCSVLFADLVGFTPLSESKDPEEVREILSRYFDVARRTITRYGGVVEKFIGDAVMAVWGTPVAEEGDTERAVRAALDLVEAVAVLGTEVGAPNLAARAGVVTGEVAVSLGAQGEGMVAGDAVNTASRVQSVADAGSVLCDEATRRLSEGGISFHDAGSFELKGKTHPEQLHRALRVLSGVGGKERADGLEAPFTGRDAELRALKDLFHTGVDRRTPRLVVVSGPAGVGKSRLGWELFKYIDGLVDTVLWHRGRCLSYGEGVAFWALAEIVRQRFGIAEEDPTEVAAGKLREGMVRYVQDEAERDYVGVRLSRLLGVPYPSETRVVLSKDELFAGWRLFFERLAQVAPVVMLVEDAQHADESLLGFFEHLVDWTRDLSVFVLLFARPGNAAIDSGYGVGRNRSTLSIDPLDDASMVTLVDSLVPGMPSDARDTITARAQGVPLFAVETVRSLIDRGVVERDGASYRLVGDLGALNVPDSLHALLASRLDALPPEVRALVADASVIGTSFPKEALVAVSGQSEDAVGTALAELVRRDVLRLLEENWCPGEWSDGRRLGVGLGSPGRGTRALRTLGRPDQEVECLCRDLLCVGVVGPGCEGVEVVPSDGVGDLLALVGEGRPQVGGDGQVAGLAVPLRQRLVGDLAEHFLAEAIGTTLWGEGVGQDVEDVAPHELCECCADGVVALPGHRDEGLLGEARAYH
ncbi:MAG: adenylate/guanylate cyclase domain-containing protein, partial [Acidimicrobiales bacterium]